MVVYFVVCGIGLLFVVIGVYFFFGEIFMGI